MTSSTSNIRCVYRRSHTFCELKVRIDFEVWESNTPIVGKVTIDRVDISDPRFEQCTQMMESMFGDADQRADSLEFALEYEVQLIRTVECSRTTNDTDGGLYDSLGGGI